MAEDGLGTVGNATCGVLFNVERQFLVKYSVVGYKGEHLIKRNIDMQPKRHGATILVVGNGVTQVGLNLACQRLWHSVVHKLV